MTIANITSTIEALTIQIEDLQAKRNQAVLLLAEANASHIAALEAKLAPQPEAKPEILELAPQPEAKPEILELAPEAAETSALLDTLGLSAGALQLFKDSHHMAGDWSGTPLLELSPKEKGYLTKLKKAGLMDSHMDEEDRTICWGEFTALGRELGLELGLGEVEVY